MTYTVLIVDDDDLNREVMEAFLTFEGYSVLVTGSGLSVLDIVESNMPDMIILDKRLPDLDGIEVCKSLKANSPTRHIPVMMITGLTDPNIRRQAQNAEVDLFFPRPFDGDDFVKAVKHILSSLN